MDFSKEFSTKEGNYNYVWFKPIGDKYVILIWAGSTARSQPAINDLPINEYSCFELAIFKYKKTDYYIPFDSGSDFDMFSHLKNLGITFAEGKGTDISHAYYVPKSQIEDVIKILEEDSLMDWEESYDRE